MDIPAAGSRWVRFSPSIAVLLCCLALPRAGHAAALARGLAATDPLALRELDLREHRVAGPDRTGFGIRRIFDPSGTSGEPMRLPISTNERSSWTASALKPR